MLDDTVEELTRQMIEENFKNQKEDKYIITKQNLYKFSIKLIKFLIKMEDYYG